MTKHIKEPVDLTKKHLSFTEAAMLADNLESIEYFRQLQRRKSGRMPSDPNAPVPLLGKVLGLVIGAALLYGFLGIAYAVISTIFMMF